MGPTNCEPVASSNMLEAKDLYRLRVIIIDSSALYISAVYDCFTEDSCLYVEIHTF